jgi:hypothetical protein
LFDTLTFAEIQVRTTFLGTLSLTVPKALFKHDVRTKGPFDVHVKQVIY